MRIRFFLAVAGVGLMVCMAAGGEVQLKDPCCSTAAKSPEKPPEKPRANKTNPTPIFGAAAIACTLTDRELQTRRAELSSGLLRKVAAVTELGDGYEFKFDGTSETVGELLKFVELERQCCGFFKFEVVLEPNGGPARLRLRGSKEVKSFIETNLLAALEAKSRK